MANAAGWVALIATCIAALMTAANLGSRVTGWGFVIFTIGAAAWIVVGIATHQTQLLFSNLFLGLVDLFGIWRWLGQRAHVDDTVRAEERRSEKFDGENIFSVSKLDGLPVKGKDGTTLGYVVDALAGCQGGAITHLIVRVGGVGGVGETLHRLKWCDIERLDDELHTSLEEPAISKLPIASN